MSIRPGSRMDVAEIDRPRPSGSPADADDPVVVDPHDAGPDDLAGVDVEQTRCLEGQHALRPPAP